MRASLTTIGAGLAGSSATQDSRLSRGKSRFSEPHEGEPVVAVVLGCGAEGCGPLYALDELDYFGINPKRPGIDFSRFRRITFVINHWLKQDTGIAKSAISKYNLWHFKPRSKSFADVEIPLGVKRLALYWANPANLDGLPGAEEPDGARNPSLPESCRPVGGFRASRPNCGAAATTSSRLVAQAGVLDHPKLQTAWIDGKERLEIHKIMMRCSEPDRRQTGIHPRTSRRILPPYPPPLPSLPLPAASRSAAAAAGDRGGDPSKQFIARFVQRLLRCPSGKPTQSAETRRATDTRFQ